MITLTIILSTLILMFIWALFVPFNITVNTIHGYYKVYIPGLIGVRMVKKNERLILKGHFLFFRFNLNKTGKKESKKMKEKKSRRILPVKNIPALFKESFHTIRKILGSMKMKRFNLEIDTGDFPLNAQLYPLAVEANNRECNIMVNFENRNNLDMIISGQVFIIMFYGLRFYIKTKYLFIKN